MKLAVVVPLSVFLFAKLSFTILFFLEKKNTHWVHIDHRDFLNPDA